MANYMAEVAKLLGVEIGEDFLIKENPDIICNFFNDDLYVRHVKDAICTIPSSKEILHGLLVKRLNIKHRSWKPKLNDWFWCVKPDGECALVQWRNDYINLPFYKLGNCYRTKADAEANCDKWSRFYASDEVLEV